MRRPGRITRTGPGGGGGGPRGGPPALGSASLVRAFLALGVALALQVGVNYANDYSDGVRGTDLNRVGPIRLTSSGAAAAGHVRAAAMAFLTLGAALGLWLVVLSGHPWLLVLGALAIAAAWFYTGGSRPYGYLGLGEVGVFLFFGLFAVLGTTYTQAGRVSWIAILGALAVGMLASALLMANNLRDIPTDALTGKRTLAVRIGDRRARWCYVVFLGVPIALGAICAVQKPWCLLVLLMTLPAGLAASAVLLGARGRVLVPILATTAQLELAFAVLLTIGFWA
jgi:1,4-dihydroxy-2-naphthoate octaprenyltransferase